ncbi:unnamed protein product, partial [Oppiella nova]
MGKPSDDVERDGSDDEQGPKGQGGANVVVIKQQVPEPQWLRSEPMSLCQLFIQSESAYACVDLFGGVGMCEFRDLNQEVNSFQRKFVNELRRCDEMERQLSLAQFQKIETDLIGVINTSADLKRNYLEFTELRNILKKTGQFFEEAQEADSTTRKEIRRVSVVDPRLMRRFSSVNQEINIPLDPVTDINFIAGTILRQKFHSFEQMLWRVCRGNIFLRQVDIDERLEDPKTGEMQAKCIFIIVFQGDQLKNKCKKICEGYHTTLYPCPEMPGERAEMLRGVNNRLEELQIVMKGTEDHRTRILVAVAKNLLEWKVMIRKMKSIYETMNMFNIDVTSKCLVAECWCPDIFIPK